MGGIISLSICGFAAINLYGQGKSVFFVIALLITVTNLWSFGVIHNFKDNPEYVPNFATITNMVSTLVGVGLLIYSFF